MFTGRKNKCLDYIAIINGYTGTVLQLTGTPDQRPLSIGPLLKGSGDGTTMILFSTGNSNDTYGSLYLASLDDITSGRKDLVINRRFSLNEENIQQFDIQIDVMFLSLFFLARCGDC